LGVGDKGSHCVAGGSPVEASGVDKEDEGDKGDKEEIKILLHPTPY